VTSGLIFLASFAISYLGVEYFRRWVVKRQLLDIPNERSSHVTPTPRGGGVVIVAVCITAYLTICYFYPASFSWGYIAGAVLIAVVSWLDDLYSIWFVWRFLAHAVAAILVIADVGYWQTLFPIELGAFGAVATGVWIVWLVNAYNFMDGIDGIAASQAVVAATGWMMLGSIFDIPPIFYFAGIVAASSLAFLLHNWQPAKIFMGDIGSAFLGFTFATLPLIAAKETNESQWLFAVAAVLFVWFFFFDTVVTFFARLVRRENVFNAHREHIYQKLVISGLSHARVTLIYSLLAITLCIATLFSIIFLEGLGMAAIGATVVLTTILIAILAIQRKAVK